MSEQQADSRKKSVIKGLTWRCLATLTTYIISYLLIGDVETAGRIAAIEFVLKFFIYYMHERLWLWLPQYNSLKKAEKFKRLEA